MRLEVESDIRLGETHYVIERSIGRGAISQVYIATPVSFASPNPVIIKFAVPDADPERQQHVVHEATVLSTLNESEDPEWPALRSVAERARRAAATATSRLIIANLDAGELPDGRPYLVQELAPPAWERQPLRNLADEWQQIQIFQKIAAAVSLAHRAGVALRDFEPRTKGDRVRVQRLAGDPDAWALKIIDWNISGDKDDFSRDLLLLGGHFYYHLFGRHLDVSDAHNLPVDLSVGVPNWEDVTAGSRLIVERLLHRDARRRYPRAADVEGDLDWWAATLKQALDPDAATSLRQRVIDAKFAERHHHQLAASELGTRLATDAQTQQTFANWAKEAREAQDKANYIPVAQARVDLKRQAFKSAEDKLEQALRVIVPTSEAARAARLYRLLAQSGQMLKTAQQGNSRGSAYERLEQAVEAILDRRWQDADTLLRAFVQDHPAAQHWSPVEQLFALLEAAHLKQQALHKLQQAAPTAGALNLAAWQQAEERLLSVQEQSVALLDRARKLAPSEPEFERWYQQETARLQQRRSSLQSYQQGEALLDQSRQTMQAAQEASRLKEWSETQRFAKVAAANYGQAAALYSEILNQDPDQRYAQQVLEQVNLEQEEASALISSAIAARQREQVLQERINQANEYAAQGNYRAALPAMQQAADLNPEEDLLQKQLDELALAQRLQNLLEDKAELLDRAAREENWREVDELASELLSWNGRSLTVLVENQFADEFTLSRGGSSTFVIGRSVRESFEELQSTARHELEQAGALEDANIAGDYARVVAILEQYQQRRDLNEKQSQLLATAQERLRERARARQLVQNAAEVRQTGTCSDAWSSLEQAALALRKDPGVEAQELIVSVIQQWVTTVEQCPLSSGDDLAVLIDQLTTASQQLLTPIHSQNSLLPLEQRCQQLQEALKLSKQLQELRKGRGDGSVEPPEWAPGPALRHLADGLRANENDWAALRELRAQWRGDLQNNLIPAYLNEREAQARRQVESRDLHQAHLTISTTLQEFTGWPLRPPSELQQLRELEAALENYEAAAKQIERAWQLFERDPLAFTVHEATVNLPSELEDLPLPSLQRQADMLAQVAAASELLQKESTSANLWQRAYKCTRSATAIFQILTNLDEPTEVITRTNGPAEEQRSSASHLEPTAPVSETTGQTDLQMTRRQALSWLRRMLRTEAVNAANEIESELATEAVRLVDDPHPNVTHFASLYWQSRRCETLGLPRTLQQAPEALLQTSQANDTAQWSLERLWEKSGQKASALHSSGEIQILCNMLQAIRELLASLRGEKQPLPEHHIPLESYRPPFPSVTNVETALTGALKLLRRSHNRSSHGDQESMVSQPAEAFSPSRPLQALDVLLSQLTDLHGAGVQLNVLSGQNDSITLADSVIHLKRNAEQLRELLVHLDFQPNYLQLASDELPGASREMDSTLASPGWQWLLGEDVRLLRRLLDAVDQEINDGLQRQIATCLQKEINGPLELQELLQDANELGADARRALITAVENVLDNYRTGFSPRAYRFRCRAVITATDRWLRAQPEAGLPEQRAAHDYTVLNQQVRELCRRPWWQLLFDWKRLLPSLIVLISVATLGALALTGAQRAQALEGELAATSTQLAAASDLIIGLQEDLTHEQTIRSSIESHAAALQTAKEELEADALLLRTTVSSQQALLDRQAANTCEDISQMRYVASGPLLIPLPDSSRQAAHATWRLVNLSPSGCSFTNLRLFDRRTAEIVIPALSPEGPLSPGSSVQLTVEFPAEQVPELLIKEYSLVVENPFAPHEDWHLYGQPEQPVLELRVLNWLTAASVDQ